MDKRHSSAFGHRADVAFRAIRLRRAWGHNHMHDTHAFEVISEGEAVELPGIGDEGVGLFPAWSFDALQEGKSFR